MLLSLLLISCTTDLTPTGTSIPVTPSVSNEIPSNITHDVSSSVQAPLSTPELLDAAFDRGMITADQRLLYLAYAIYEPESLPEKFHSDAPWRGTLYVMELKRATSSAENLCAMPLETRNELQRLVSGSATCKP